MQLTLNDVQGMVQIIDTVTARGAFRGEELSQIGGFRDKLVAVLKASAEPQDDEDQETPSQYPRDAIDAG